MNKIKKIIPIIISRFVICFLILNFLLMSVSASNNTETINIGTKNIDTVKEQDISCFHCHSKVVSEFQKSVHNGKILCTNCHGGDVTIKGTIISIDVMTKELTKNISSKILINNLCINCHKNAVALYKESIHWKLLADGRTEAPSCLDCHGIHNILSYKDPNSMTYFDKVPQTCANCHENQTKMKAWYYGISTDRFDTYKKSYHYKAIILKDDKQRLSNGKGLATCPDCHENHNTKNESDPTSAIFPANLAVTCGKSECHPNQNAIIYGGKIHEGQSVYLLSIDLKKLITYFYIAMILFEVSFTFGLIFLGIYSKIEVIKRSHNNRKNNNH